MQNNPQLPDSMIGEKEARYTLRNNLDVTFNVIWSVIEECPDCHIVKLGTMRIRNSKYRY